MTRCYYVVMYAYQSTGAEQIIRRKKIRATVDIKRDRIAIFIIVQKESNLTRTTRAAVRLSVYVNIDSFYTV